MKDAVTEPEELRTVRDAFTRFMDAFNAGAFEQAFSDVTEDFEVVLPPGYPERSVSGRENVIHHYRALWESLNWQVEVREVLEVGPHRYLIELEGRGRGNVSGLTTDRRFWNLLEVEQGRARRLREFAEREQALHAAGSHRDPGADD
jgi:hypothetical protein